MKRSVLVYRAESGAQSVFGAQQKVTPPSERRPIDSFTINEPDVDKARRVASDFVKKRYDELPESVHMLVGGGISVTLRAVRS